MVNITKEFSQEDLYQVYLTACKRVAKKIPLDLRNLEPVSFQVFVGGNYTGVVIKMEGETCLGVAKRNPSDLIKHDVGISIAMHRAVRAIFE